MTKISKAVWDAFPLDFASVIAEDFKGSDDYLAMFSYDEDDHNENEYMAVESLKNEKYARSLRRLNKFEDHRSLTLKRNMVEFWIYRSKDGRKFLPVAKRIIGNINVILSTDCLNYL